jgi:hypothetical protein
MPITITRRRELAHRIDAGLEVTLYWSPSDNSTTIDVLDTETDELFIFPVPADRALDAFRHPFAYLTELDVAEAA